MTEPERNRQAQLLLTVRETSEVLRLSRNSTYDLISRREIPSIRLGRAIRVPREALEQWVASAADIAGEADPPALR